MFSLHFLLKCAICISSSQLLSKLDTALQRWLYFLCGLKSRSDYKYKTYAVGKGNQIMLPVKNTVWG